ncbi:hypothetical protein A8U91_01281 [Halomonas elongata]|uniref:Uncharacterized protein n=1 Tax=Halomonas elongata TaxID=2746 RepID=A0A1B8P418_HALEL|nr:hypothetical protein [Halomonas elongata]OBX36933.1 hypothetical protein A8U91_01281 [Halomonas elongata]
MSIDPEQLLKLAKDRHGPAGVTLGWPTVMQIVEGLRERNRLAIDVGRLRAVAENMDHFNDGDDLAEAEAALSDSGDTLDEAFSRRDAAIKAEALADACRHIRHEMLSGCQVLTYLARQAEKYHRQSEEAPCSSTSPSASPSASC